MDPLKILSIRPSNSCAINTKPEPSLVPLFMEALLQGNPEGKNAEDVFARTLANQNKEVYERLIAGWKDMTHSEKRKKYSKDNSDTPNRSWIERVEAQTKTILKYKTNRQNEIQQVIDEEFDMALTKGINSYKPSEKIRNNKTLSYNVQKEILDRFGIISNTEDKCCRKSKADDDASSTPNYGLNLRRIECKKKDEIGHDEIYLISIVVDNTGNPVLKTTNKFSMDPGNDRNKYPNEWLYPLKNPDGYLDFAGTVWEDDGGYKEAAAAAAALAAGLAAIPDVTATKIAAIALGVVAGLLAVGNWLDSDDKFGNISKTFSTDSQLASEVGEFMESVINYDTGWSDFTSYHYNFYIELAKTD